MKALSFIHCALLLTLAPGLLSGATPDDDVLSADRKRVSALLRADRANLDALLADELVYGHADGRVQTKPELLNALTSGFIKYESYDGPSPQVRMHGEIALLHGTADLLASARGESVRFSLRYLAVYKRFDDDWKLIAYQSSPLAKPRGP
jgi:ketosteroid isomerase-like protein